MTTTQPIDAAVAESQSTVVHPLIVCVCGGYGFPHGTASTQRILMIGRALVSAGYEFRVLHCGPSPNSRNAYLKSVYQGVKFEYLGGRLARPEGRWRRALIYAKAMLQLPSRLRRLPRPACVHLYRQGDLLALYVGLLCRLLQIPVVQEICEWWPGVPETSWFCRFSYWGPMFWLSSGALVISHEIGQRAARRTWRKRGWILKQLPALVDCQEWPEAELAAGSDLKTFVWCGVLAGYLKDVEFVLQAMAKVKAAGFRAGLVLVGPCDRRCQAKVEAMMARAGLGPQDVTLAGYVDRSALARYCQQAAALLQPMFEDDRSQTRMPNKIGEYLAVGRPVISSPIGEIAHLLRDGVSALLPPAGDVQKFADAMMLCLRDPQLASRVGKAGRLVCQARLDFRLHGQPLGEFFSICARLRMQRRLSCFPDREIYPHPAPFRKGLGYFVASGTAGLGLIRRALARIDREHLIVPLYFHNPDERLFRKCIEWLYEHDFRFVSSSQLADILYHGGEIPRRAVWLTFDDGWNSLAWTVIPYIQRYRVPVTLFVPSSYVSRGGPFWWRACRTCRSELERVAGVSPGKLWHMPDSERRAAVDKVMHLPGIQYLGDDCFSLSQLRQLLAIPEITIGSHSHTHPVLNLCTQRELEQEMVESKQRLEGWTGRLVDTFAYPFGDWHSRETECARASGYRLAASTWDGFITRASNPFALPRLGVADRMSVAEAICNMVGVWPEIIETVRPILPGPVVRRFANR